MIYLSVQRTFDKCQVTIGLFVLPSVKEVEVASSSPVKSVHDPNWSIVSITSNTAINCSKTIEFGIKKETTPSIIYLNGYCSS